ncbi:MAG: biliverdin-producing heme oxygenase [Bacteroidetes bacterium]|jgi:heme oxygenase|nr:biliverdin-producing heme oxygenase [Bacteroidota bacterium]
MIRERIKNETAQNHKDVEAVGFSGQIMSGRLTLDEYKKLILTNLMLNKGFEAQWSELDFEIPKGIMLEQRRKTATLEKDAKALGVSIPDTDNPLFPADTYEAFIGSLYVFEGSTLGGAIIYKQLKQNANLSTLDDFHFYSCYGERLGMMWKIFLDHLNEIEDTLKVDKAIEAAKTTFDITKNTFVRMNQETF